MVGTSSNCKDCKNRKVGCHADCKKYLNWKKEYDAQVKQAKQIRNTHNNFFYHK